MLDTTPKPPEIARLPRNKAGYPIPWFVADLPDGTRDFRIADQEKHVNALRLRLCWICGGHLGAYGAFVIGPMCAVNRISGEPPGHRSCAVYSAKVCPWLSTPQMRRREGGIAAGTVEAAGMPILRNPGVALVWITRRWTHFQPQMGNAGWLTQLGTPTELHWYSAGRAATREEILASMESGLPSLQEVCQLDDNPVDSLRMLDEQYRRALALVPAGA